MGCDIIVEEKHHVASRTKNKYTKNEYTGLPRKTGLALRFTGLWEGRCLRQFRGRRLAWAGLVAGVLLMAAGMARGEFIAVLYKASRICLECIGVG